MSCNSGRSASSPSTGGKAANGAPFFQTTRCDSAEPRRLTSASLPPTWRASRSACSRSRRTACRRTRASPADFATLSTTGLTGTTFDAAVKPFKARGAHAGMRGSMPGVALECTEDGLHECAPAVPPSGWRRSNAGSRVERTGADRMPLRMGSGSGERDTSMRLGHQLLVYLGVREPRAEDRESWALADPAPWWRILLAGTFAAALLTALAWAFTEDSLGEALLFAVPISVAVTVIGVIRERRELGRQRRSHSERPPR